MKFFLHAENLTQQSLSAGLPAPPDFVPFAPIPENVRGDKQARQAFYRNPETNHYFYTLTEPSNPNQRVSKKDNPPRLLHGVVADFDLPISLSRIQEFIDTTKIRPSYVERSLGGNCRLVYCFERPLPVDSYEFAMLVLKKAREWLSLDRLPGLDQNALEDPARLYCNGCDWKSTGFDCVPAPALQAFFVEAGRAFDFRAVNQTIIPLDVVHAELVRKYPSFVWPTEFSLGSQGPSFWVEGSTSPLSAVVKPEGLFTFAAHATKPFSTWTDLLGAEFCKAFAEQSMATATDGLFYDGLKYWRKLPNGSYVSETKEDIQGFFKTTCKLSMKLDSAGCSPMDRAFQHIRDRQRIYGAAPMLYYPRGEIVTYQGSRYLNISNDSLVKPVERPVAWSDMPFISALWDGLFAPATQLPYFIAWLSHFYKSAHAGKLLPGQAIFLAGGTGIGKGLTSGGIIGGLMGGSIDARNFILGEDQFGGHLFEFPVWTVDDETVADNEASRNRFSTFLKKIVANQQWLYHQKFQKPVSVPWMGRAIVTLNLDFISCRVMPSLDNSTAEKISMFRCVETTKIDFPDRYEVEKILQTERPLLARYLLDYQIAPELRDTNRYGVKAFQEPSLRQRAHQTSRNAQFRELVVELCKNHFHTPSEQNLRGSTVQFQRMLMGNPLNSEVLRSLRLDSMSRCFEAMERAGDMGMTSETDDLGVRFWVVPRGDRFRVPGHVPAPPIPPERQL